MPTVLNQFPAPLGALLALHCQKLAPGVPLPTPIPTQGFRRSWLIEDPISPQLIEALLAGPTTSVAETQNTRLALPPGRLQLLCAPDAGDAALRIPAAVTLHAARLQAGADLAHALEPRRVAWAQTLQGHLFVCGAELRAGQGCLLRDESVLAVYAQNDSLLLLAELPV